MGSKDVPNLLIMVLCHCIIISKPKFVDNSWRNKVVQNHLSQSWRALLCFSHSISSSQSLSYTSPLTVFAYLLFQGVNSSIRRTLWSYCLQWVLWFVNKMHYGIAHIFCSQSNNDWKACESREIPQALTQWIVLIVLVIVLVALSINILLDTNNE